MKVDKTKAEKPARHGTYIESCICKNAYQDEHYGKGFRVHNCKKEGGTCTVCGRVKDAKK